MSAPDVVGSGSAKGRVYRLSSRFLSTFMFLCCLAALAPTGAAQTPANVGCFNVHKELSIGITEETEMVRGVFDRFFNTYVVQMQQRANSEQQSD